MVTRAPYAVVRWTHLPTGITAQADGCDHARGGARIKWAHVIAHKHLLAKLCRAEATPIHRLYHLCPAGIEPFVRQNGVNLAVGREAVTAVLNGRIPEPKGLP